MGKLASKLKKAQEERDKPLWEGPSSNGPNGGITQSMLNNFLVCRERFRVRYVLGLQPTDSFNHRIEYGSMWHACEESLAAKETDPWLRLDKKLVDLCEKYPLQKSDIFHWYNICKLQFPVYREYWAEHEDVQDRTPLMQEEVFCVPYEVPSGRTVYLRGKFDSVDLIGGKVWLQENKTKGDIDPVLMQRQLTFDLQTGFYLTALNFHELPSNIAGVHYNVIRRPLSGGKGSIRQKKNQTQEEFYEELGNLIRTATGPEWGVAPDEHFFFMRWKVDISPKDIEVFKAQFLNPILEQLCDWWTSIELDSGDPWTCVDTSDEYLYYEWKKGRGRKQTAPNVHHWRTPYGIYSPLYDGKPTELDEYLATGSTVGLHRAEKLFKELEE